jgi:hypothetical protein
MAQGIARWRRADPLSCRKWIRPPLTELVDAAPEGDQWLHESNSTVTACRPRDAKLCKVAIRGDRCGGSASASRRLGYLSPEASLSAMLSVQTAGEGLVRLESAKVLDA